MSDVIEPPLTPTLRPRGELSKTTLWDLSPARVTPFPPTAGAPGAAAFGDAGSELTVAKLDWIGLRQVPCAAGRSGGAQRSTLQVP